MFRKKPLIFFYSCVAHKLRGQLICDVSFSSWSPNRHTMSNRRRFDIGITLICQKENMDEFLRHFDVLLRCNFNGRKIEDVWTYFVWRNFNGKKIDVVSMYFLNNFDGKLIKIWGTDFDVLKDKKRLLFYISFW